MTGESIPPLLDYPEKVCIKNYYQEVTIESREYGATDLIKMALDVLAILNNGVKSKSSGDAAG